MHCVVGFLAPGDYIPIVGGVLTIPINSLQFFESCQSVTVIGDLDREVNETFTVEMVPENDNDLLNSSSFQVVILNDDGGGGGDGGSDGKGITKDNIAKSQNTVMVHGVCNFKLALNHPTIKFHVIILHSS